MTKKKSEAEKAANKAASMAKKSGKSKSGKSKKKVPAKSVPKAPVKETIKVDSKELSDSDGGLAISLDNILPEEVSNDSFYLETKKRMEEIEAFCDRDPIVQEIRRNYSSVNVLKETLIRLAEISAIISYERREAMAKGQSGSLIARREITALTSLRDATLKMIDQRLKQQQIDLESTMFMSLMGYIVRTFHDSMAKAGVPFNEQRTVMSNLSKAVDQKDWKVNAYKTMGIQDV